ncbi:MAG: 16S rRNA (cytosine(1402)-N(4))-methyltransferase RsmH [Treponema sp.]|jgi:16S rRNA (cytosine1402-N4)-methyltransferase|nr:16S rRNA (cytosine(1402)-N(4))-methyltransferase RsmH [Treponema sp.]
MEIVHTPVLLEETLQLLAPRQPGELMIDATVGEGGHSYAFLSRFPDLRLIGIDADREIQEVAKKRLEVFGERVHWYTGWSHDFFADFSAEKPDTILIDLGVSRYHYEKGGRGFSFLRDEVLDMRIDRTQGLAAAELIADLSEKALADLLYTYGEERYARRIARSITEAKSRGGISRSGTLADIVVQALPLRYRGNTHPATRTFQALRIAVNGELTHLQELLEKALTILKPGGRMGVITFHSLEDRIVKHFFREKGKDYTSPQEQPIYEYKRRGKSVNVLYRKGITPGAFEIRHNPSSRSARLRIAEKVVDEDVCLQDKEMR